MILNDVVKRVKTKSHRGNVNITTDQITLDIIEAINDARRDVIKLLPKDWLRKPGSFATVSGTTTYSLASDVQELLLIRYTTLDGTDYFPVKVNSEREFYQQVYGSTVSNNRPTRYLELGLDGSGNKQIMLFPTPDAAYTIEYVYYKDPTKVELTVADLSTEIPDLPSYIQDVLWKGARYYFLQGFDDTAGQTIANTDFEKSKLALEISDNLDLDSEMSFRFGTDQNVRAPNTGIRID